MKRKLRSRKYWINGTLLIFAVFALEVNAQNQKFQPTNKEWIGVYKFFDSEKSRPRNRPGNYSAYTLTLFSKDEFILARFSADGPQISDDYECRTDPNSRSIKILFGKDLNGMNESRFKPFKKGELLFTLVKTRVSKKTKYLYQSGGYEIMPHSFSRSKKIYFVKNSK